MSVQTVRSSHIGYGDDNFVTMEIAMRVFLDGADRAVLGSELRALHDMLKDGGRFPLATEMLRALQEAFHR